ncbi:MAG: ribose 5-phosphate isomerase A [Sulfolobales archaeon]|nr:ribose 5-phosphate isomerase A [Sulfolobales archaeon]MCX8198550.1 ribose 5-phosphate isomerase A [Sulfolobales archaeon]MDW8169623.1 ribose 5-phosphate isomerase A [Desulfurococcaceae archaeon]
MDLEEVKVKLSREALKDLEEYIHSAEVIGLGSGSTIKYFINELVKRELHVGKIIVSTSIDTTLYALSLGLKNIADLTAVNYIDVYIDGADEVSSKLDLVKGRGGAFIGEKLVAARSRHRFYIVDYTKYTNLPYLLHSPIPIAVVSKAIPWILRELELNGLFKPIIRAGGGKLLPIITDEGFPIIDLVHEKPISDADTLNRTLKSIIGVVETGLFPNKLVSKVYVGYMDKVEIIEKTKLDTHRALQ